MSKMRSRERSASRLAIVVSHPIQYYAPWFAYLEKHLGAQVQVFYLWDFGIFPQMDPDLGCELVWDIDLLSGYDHRFVPNEAENPGTHHFHGLDNPELSAELAEWQPDAILLFGYRYSSHLRVLFSRRLKGVPVLFRGDSHLLADRGTAAQREGRRLIRRLLFRRFAAFLSVGRAHRDYLERSGIPERKIFFAPHAVDNDRFLSAGAAAEEDGRKWKRTLDIPEDHRVVLFAGKLERKKRPDLLIAAFLAGEFSGTTLLLVGHGALEEELRGQAAGHASIRFAPFQNQRAMPRTYAAADLVALPSCGSGETWGLVINEAMCCGRAVLVSDEVGCQADLVRHGRNGLVVRAGSKAALTGGLREALGDPARLKAWGEEGRRMIAAYSYEETTTGLENALTWVWTQRKSR